MSPAVRGLLESPRTAGERAPDAIAVRAGDRALTRERFDEAVSDLADRLARLGLPRHSPIGIRLGSALWLPVALLAVARAGHTWHPQPLDWPPPPTDAARISDGDGESALTVTAVDRDRGPSAFERFGERLAGTLPGPGGAAPVTRGELERRLRQLADAWRVAPGDRFLVIAPLTAHGVVDTLLALDRGGELVLPDRTDERRFDRLGHLATAGRPRFLHTTPAVWYRLLEAGPVGHRGMTAIASGAPLPTALARRLAESAAEVWQVLGVPEAAHYAAMHRFDRDRGGATVPVGRAFGGLAASVLDADLRPVPEGETGEICLVGEGLPDGYADRPASATAERFAPDPSPARPGARVLRTGQSGRVAPDGALEHRGPAFGRRGFPETGAFDLEQRLAAIDGVGQCAVVDRPGDCGEPQSAVHLVLTEQSEAVFDAIAAVLAEHPAEHRLMLRPFLPLTGDGLVDHAALAAPAAAAAVGGRAPGTAEERTIAGLWADLLEIAEPPADVSFFEVGGHSLATTKLANRIEESFDLHVPVADLFRHTTVAEQAALVERLYDQQIDDLSDLDEDGGHFTDSPPTP